MSHKSYQKIPYPLPHHLLTLHTAYEAGEMKIPNNVVPVHIPEYRCKHGNYFSSDDTISSNWVVSNEVIVYKYSATITSPNRKLYYRLAEGCDCKFFYDDKHLFITACIFM